MSSRHNQVSWSARRDPGHGPNPKQTGQPRVSHCNSTSFRVESKPYIASSNLSIGPLVREGFADGGRLIRRYSGKLTLRRLARSSAVDPHRASTTPVNGQGGACSRPTAALHRWHERHR
ncbi:hypothetical protein NL676_036822 [Syzygium grande]|nr:hypothetical protein NL676_036822 [Syzygium grande]